MAQAAPSSLRRQSLRAILCAASLAALAVSPLAGADASQAAGEYGIAQSILPFGAVWALGLWGLWQLYGAWLGMKRPLADRPLWLLSALFAALLVLGQSYAATGTAALVAQRPALSVLAFMGWVPLCCAAMALLQNALRQTAAVASRRRPGWQVAIGLLVCWVPYLYFIYPGTVSKDTISQVMEIIGVETLSNANPVFQTALVYLFRGAGVVLKNMDAAVFLYCGVQALLMAWLLGVLLADMAKSGAPRWLLPTSFLFFALTPVFPLFAFCMGKDTNFAMAVLWLSLLTLRYVRSADQPRPGQIVWLSLSGVLCVLLRNPGVYLAALTLAMLLLWTLLQRKKGRWLAPTAALAAVAVVYAALHWLVLPGLQIAPMPETENWSVPLQQTARVATAHGLTPEETAALSGALDTTRLADAYNGEISDPVKLLWNQNADEEQKAAFFQTWRGLLRKYPATCLSATFHNSYGYLYPGYLCTIKPTLLIGRQKSSSPQVQAAFPYSVNPRAEGLRQFFNSLTVTPLYRILIAPGLYGWLCLFATATLLRRKSGGLLIAAVPALFSLAGCLFSAVNGYFRYAMPLYICAPLLLLLCALGPGTAKERD